MNQICINKVCFEFSIYYFIYLIILIILGNYIIDFFRTPKEKLKEDLYNINYDLPDVGVYPGQYLSRSTVQTRSNEDIDEINKDYDKYNFLKPKLTYQNPLETESIAHESSESKSITEYSPLAITESEPIKKKSKRKQKTLKKTTYKSEQLKPLQPPEPTFNESTRLLPLAPGQGISNTNYSSGATRLNPQIEMVQLPNGGLTDYELIRRRDLGVMADPLAPPEKRTERPQIDMTLPLLRNKYIGLPTRGSYDTYQQTGYLVDDTNSNNILKLFGRQKYPGSSQYEYYAMKSTAADQYKIPLNDIKKQLFDNDSVTLVKLFPGTYKYVEFKQEELI
jgi:hypothetical protein